MRDICLLRSCIFLFLLSFVWFMLGAPIQVEEWQDIPHRLSLMFTQLPVRVGSILSHWR